MKRTLLILALITTNLAADPAAPADGKGKVTATKDEEAGVVKVLAGGQPFTELDYKKYAKPVLTTLTGPTGVNLLRNWPMRDATEGEEKDHPHHKGLWFTHGSVNGVDFWAENAKAGKIVVTSVPKVTQDHEAILIETAERWNAPDGRKVCSSITLIRAGLDGEDRYIDYTIIIHAGEGDVTFGDTKEGTMGIRSHPALNLKGKVATARAVNSEGGKDAAIWGKKARWVDYTGQVEGKTVGIACFDAPGNLRHPTTWHARDYGLIAANPFGLHDFDKKTNAAGAGNHTIKKGESLTLRYLWLFHKGDTEEAKIEERWKKWAARRSRE